MAARPGGKSPRPVDLGGLHGWAGFPNDDLLPEDVACRDEEVSRFAEIFLS